MNDCNPKYPDHLRHLGTHRQFKALKRSEIVAVIAALSKLRLGCAYTPFHEFVDDAERAIRKAQALASVKNWGR